MKRKYMNTDNAQWKEPELTTLIKSSQVKSCLRCKYTATEHISINKA